MYVCISISLNVYIYLNIYVPTLEYIYIYTFPSTCNDDALFFRYNHLHIQKYIKNIS